MLDWATILQALIVAGVTAAISSWANFKVFTSRVIQLERQVSSLTSAFESFRLELARSSISWQDFRPFHERLHKAENEVIRMATLLSAKGIDRDVPPGAT